MSPSDTGIAALLVDRGSALFSSRNPGVSFTDRPEANLLINDLAGCPHAFVVGCLMDRQIKAERAWLIPHALSERLGGFDFDRLSRLTKHGALKAMTEPTALHRFNEDLAACLVGVIRIISERYAGDASRIWSGRPSSATVVYRFLELPGFGPKLATMAANILARDFKIPMSDHYSIDISVDVHVRRVFTRLGLVPEGSSTESIVYRARSLHPQFPGILDSPCWDIGKRWCKPSRPHCTECPMNTVCEYSRAIRP